jgi:Astacin (Peptidase family M12A)
MRKRPVALCVALALSVGTPFGIAQDTGGRDPHVPPLATGSWPTFVQVDDMLLLPEQLGDDRYRTQGNPVDYRQRLGTWDAGVIPYQIADAFSAVETQRIRDKLSLWMQVAPVRFVPRTSQSAYLTITRDAALPTQASACFSAVGQARRGLIVRTNLGDGCQTDRTVAHELGHAIGLFHEHQRPDRDNYVTIDFSNVLPNAVGNFNVSANLPLVGEYDFGSIMHYSQRAFAANASRPTIIPHAPYSQFAATMGNQPNPSETDHAVVAFLYNQQLRESTIRTPTE